MIRLGFDLPGKQAEITRYIAGNDICRVVVLSPDRYAFTVPFDRSETVGYEHIIEYVYFYRLLQEIDGRTLVVVNECLRTQDRNDLTFNCIRHFLNQAGHVIVFQYLPLIDTADDFMVLLDFDTRSKWKRQGFTPSLLNDVDLEVERRSPIFTVAETAASAAMWSRYTSERERLFAGIGDRDPHTIPRNLHMVSGEARRGSIQPERPYVARNQRFKLTNVRTYEQAQTGPEYTILDWPHRFIDFTDFLAVTRLTNLVAVSSDLPVDRWYVQRYQEWKERLDACYPALQR